MQDARGTQDPPPLDEASPALLDVLESAARLQQLGRAAVIGMALAFRLLRMRRVAGHQDHRGITTGT